MTKRLWACALAVAVPILVQAQTPNLEELEARLTREQAAEAAQKAEAQRKAEAARQAKASMGKLSVPAPSRFAQVDGGVMDYQQNLIWAARDNGSDINWAGAGQYCAAKGGGWSLPTVAQLQSLYDESGKFARSVTLQRGTFDVKLATPLISPTGWWYWSSEPNGPSLAWVVSLPDGHRGSGFVSYAPDDKRALCVRRP